jgi:single-strand DNA-binding protein
MSVRRSSTAEAPAPTALAAAPPPGTNLVVLRGVLSREPEVRALPSGSTLVAYELTVRAEGPDPARAESVPVCWFDPPAAATGFAEGADVVVVGRVRRRFFRAGGATASRTEVVADRVLPARSSARCREAVGRALDRLAGPAGGG